MDNNTFLTQSLRKWSEFTVQQSMHGIMHFMRSHDLSYSQISVLYRIYHHGPTDFISISRELQISKAGAGQLIDRMIQAGWLISQPSPTDKRSKIITLTEAGSGLVLSSQTASMGWIDEFINRIPSANVPEVIKGIMPLIINIGKNHTRED